MINVVDESTWWKPLLTSAIFTWLGGTANLYNKRLAGDPLLKYFHAHLQFIDSFNLEI